MDRLTEVNAFVKVVQTGSFAEAARKMNVSSAIISRHVKELEEWLKVRLLNRTTRHVALTEIGHVVYERCTAALNQFQALEEAASDWRGAPRGLLRVSAPMVCGTTILAAKLPEFLARYPHIDIDLILTDRHVDLIEDGLDVAIELGNLPDSSAMTRMLCHFHSGLYANPTYLEANGWPEKIENLIDHECISHTLFGDGWTLIDSAGKSHMVRPTGRLRTNSATVVMMGLVQGYGIGLMPHYLAAESVASGTLKRVLPDYEPSPIPVRACYHPGRYQAAKLPVFVDFLISLFSTIS